MPLLRLRNLLSPLRRATWLAPVLAVLAIAAPAVAQTASVGTVTGLPTPRFVSLKADRVNLREGPSKDNRTSWVFQRAGLPVEVTGEFEIWRRIRDAEGAEGWVLHSLLSGRRTVLIAPWTRDGKAEQQALYARADERSGVVAYLEPGVLGSVRQCDGVWCRIHGGRDKFDGYIRQERLWGVYPNERVE